MGPYATNTPLTQALVEDDHLRVRELTRDSSGGLVISHMAQLPMVAISAGPGAGGTSAMFFDDPAAPARVNLLEACFYGGAMEVARDLAGRIAPTFREPFYRLGDRLARYLANPDTKVTAASDEIEMIRTYLQAGAKMRGLQQSGGWKAVLGAPVICDDATLNQFLFSTNDMTLPYALAESGAFGSTSALKHLLAEGAMDVNDRSARGTTLLMHAVQASNGRTLQMLLDAGADPKLEVRTAGGRTVHTALSIARVNNDDESIAAIEAHCAKNVIDRVLSAAIKRRRP